MGEDPYWRTSRTGVLWLYWRDNYCTPELKVDDNGKDWRSGGSKFQIRVQRTGQSNGQTSRQPDRILPGQRTMLNDIDASYRISEHVDKSNNDTSMVDSTKVLCPFLTQLRFLISGDSPSIYPSLDKMWNFNPLLKRRKMTLLMQFIKLEWMRKKLCPFHSRKKALSPAVDLFLRPTLLLYDM